MNIFRKDLRGVVWDWGNTLMRDIPGQTGPMAQWPRVEAMPGADAATEAFAFLPVQCVATNAADSDGGEVAKALGRVGLRDRLTHFFTSRELGMRKPDPGFFSEVSRQVEIPPSQLLAVGNSYLKDIVPAKAAGMATVLVASSVDPLTLEAADLVVPSLAHLAELLQDHASPQQPPVVLREDLPDPAAYFALFETTGWNQSYGATQEDLFEAIRNSWFTVSAYDEDHELVGFGRVVSDGHLYAFVCDMIVTPEHQRRGIGSRIMEVMIVRCREAGIRVLWLFSASGKAGFYRKHGLEERPQSAPGMQMNLNTRD